MTQGGLVLLISARCHGPLPWDTKPMQCLASHVQKTLIIEVVYLIRLCVCFNFKSFQILNVVSRQKHAAGLWAIGVGDVEAWLVNWTLNFEPPIHNLVQAPLPILRRIQCQVSKIVHVVQRRWLTDPHPVSVADSELTRASALSHHFFFRPSCPTQDFSGRSLFKAACLRWKMRWGHRPRACCTVLGVTVMTLSFPARNPTVFGLRFAPRAIPSLRQPLLSLRRASQSMLRWALCQAMLLRWALCQAMLRWAPSMPRMPKIPRQFWKMRPDWLSQMLQICLAKTPYTSQLWSLPSLQNLMSQRQRTTNMMVNCQAWEAMSS